MLLFFLLQTILSGRFAIPRRFASLRNQNVVPRRVDYTKQLKPNPLRTVHSVAPSESFHQRQTSTLGRPIQFLDYSNSPSYRNPSQNFLLTSSQIKPMRTSKYTNPSHQVKPVQFRSTKYSQPRTIIPPDLAPVLDVITKGTAEIDAQVLKIVEDGQKIMHNASLETTRKTQQGIEAEVSATNTLIQTDLTTIFVRNKTLIEELVFLATTNETADVTKLIESQKTALLTAIAPLIADAQTQVNNLTDLFSTIELNDLSALITTSNQSVYDQIAAILGDQTNTSPILPQVTFPDPVVIAESITPGKEQLKIDIETILTDLFTKISTEIGNVTNTKITGVQDIVHPVSLKLVSDLEAARDTVLSEVRASIDTHTPTEISNLSALIKTNYADLTTQVENTISTFNTSIEQAIQTVTQLEITNILPVIQQYNRDVAAQVVLPTY